jgi:hypothetical protein
MGRCEQGFLFFEKNCGVGLERIVFPGTKEEPQKKRRRLFFGSEFILDLTIDSSWP